MQCNRRSGDTQSPQRGHAAQSPQRGKSYTVHRSKPTPRAEQEGCNVQVAVQSPQRGNGDATAAAGKCNAIAAAGENCHRSECTDVGTQDQNRPPPSAKLQPTPWGIMPHVAMMRAGVSPQRGFLASGGGGLGSTGSAGQALPSACDSIDWPESSASDWPPSRARALSTCGTTCSVFTNGATTRRRPNHTSF